jgi:hypothetical protein
MTLAALLSFGTGAPLAFCGPVAHELRATATPFLNLIDRLIGVHRLTLCQPLCQSRFALRD